MNRKGEFKCFSSSKGRGVGKTTPIATGKQQNKNQKRNTMIKEDVLKKGILKIPYPLHV